MSFTTEHTSCICVLKPSATFIQCWDHLVMSPFLIHRSLSISQFLAYIIICNGYHIHQRAQSIQCKSILQLLFKVLVNQNWYLRQALCCSFRAVWNFMVFFPSLSPSYYLRIRLQKMMQELHLPNASVQLNPVRNFVWWHITFKIDNKVGK